MLVSVLCTCSGSLPDRTTALRIVLGQEATSVERAALGVFSERVRQHTARDPGIMAADSSARSLVVGTAGTNEEIRVYLQQHPEIGSLGNDGFHLATRPDSEGRIYVIGRNSRGIVAGLGRLLRISHFNGEALVIPPVILTEVPALPIRGVYLATHFHNFYHTAPLPEVDQIIEELALWGANSLAVGFDMSHFDSFLDPVAQANLERLQHFGKTAKSLGMDFGLIIPANESYSTTPQPIRRKWIPASPDSYVCASLPEGMKHLSRVQTELFGAFSQIDFVISFAHDHGGCGCDQCMPWGGNGFLRASELLQRSYRKRFPNGKFWLSAWIFDKPPFTGEYDGLFRYLEEHRPSWIDGILMDGLEHENAARIHERPAPELFVLTSFPEITMTEFRPWGAGGAIPLPERWTGQFVELRDKTVGGWPYSEGIYDDLNKFLWIQHYWDPLRSVDDLLAQYASYYFDPSCAQDGVRLLQLLEKGHERHRWSVRNLDHADEAWCLAQEIDEKLRLPFRSSWRWRLVYLRSQFDHILRYKGHISPEARAELAPLIAELHHLYHVAPETKKLVRPLPLFEPERVADENAENLAFNRPVQVSSTYPSSEFVDSGWALTDGSISNQNPEGFFRFDIPTVWANDPTWDREPWILIDLGSSKEIQEVRIQFRGKQTKKRFRASFSWANHVYQFIPFGFRFASSENEEDFATIGTSVEVPKEGSRYESRLWKYTVEGRGRYLQISLGPSQHATGTDSGLIKLSQVQVFGK